MFSLSNSAASGRKHKTVKIFRKFWNLDENWISTISLSIFRYFQFISFQYLSIFHVLDRGSRLVLLHAKLLLFFWWKFSHRVKFVDHLKKSEGNEELHFNFIWSATAIQIRSHSNWCRLLWWIYLADFMIALVLLHLLLRSELIFIKILKTFIQPSAAIIYKSL